MSPVDTGFGATGIEPRDGGLQVVVATRNPHKVEELQRILAPLLPGVELLPDDGPEPVEDGDTFEANALIKARAAHERTGLPALADDSGIEVDALGGAPGIHSARYAGTRDDRDNLELLLANLAGARDRAARFVCAAAWVDADGETVVRGEWQGEIADAPRGEGGFGYDPIFVPHDGGGRAAAELTAEEKDALSHRRIAFSALAERIARG
ncbi:RdgB/HAM1 family non-canonical purine NTP pyrophosphatase [Agrococcus sp. HG114]|uniref:RdgB/HAM1 family non-canonical purine NTP pyrophosphatase n=1 Tax=Agrococcus sp. HG114 TaxID=2969757 RepID=UPI00215ABE72|nr:RdgB/HAM1 family non-canonical purine NTP pyrophosphatase [Agrococcus sp. HG114]MCR8671403.1 RdgB/HAM1 family non-canonical purine NTP pyrophosphatase [Agrococcus sp. HG114]